MAKRVWLVSIMALAMAGTGYGVATAVLSPDRSPSGKIGLLERPIQQKDALPASFLKVPAAQRMNVTQARLAGEFEGRNYYVIPGKGQTTCLIYVTDMGESAGTCAATTGLMKSGLYFTEVGGAGESEAITALVTPDGFDAAKANSGAAVRGRGANLLVLKGTPPSQVTIKGPNLPDLVWDIGRQATPE